MLRVDLEDFFPTIHFGRVRGVLEAPPFSLGARVSMLLAHLCCRSGVLPQGAPTSPVMSNLVCRKLDGQLMELARRHQCFYTRYADDLVFSGRSKLPRALATVDKETGLAVAGQDVCEIVEGNGFQVNDSKTVLRYRHQRQMVTGLIANKRRNVPREYVRRLRAQLFAWEKHGEEVSERMVLNTNVKNRPPGLSIEVRPILRGRVQHVGYIRGWDDTTYRALAGRLARLDDGFKLKDMPASALDTKVHLFCEGKSDYDHLEAAIRHFQERGRLVGQEFEFEREKESDGGAHLLETCKRLSKAAELSTPHVCVFDCDEDKVLKEVVGPQGLGAPKDWGNGVFSVVLQKPTWREGDQYCIELLYTDEDLARVDGKGRRVFLREEFDDVTCRHKSDDELTCPHVLDRKKLVPEKVVNRAGINVALSKTGFSRAILNKTPPYDAVSFGGFEGTITLLENVIARWPR